MSEGLSQILTERLKPIRLVVFDVDGTLTDGAIHLGDAEEAKSFNGADGLGIVLLLRAGIEVAWITGRRSGAVERRAGELGVRHVFQGVEGKAAVLRALAADLGISAGETAAMGDDLPDLRIFAASGVRLAVAGAAPELAAEADWISSRPGGRGAAREAAELILKAQRKWDGLVGEYRAG